MLYIRILQMSTNKCSSTSPTKDSEILTGPTTASWPSWLRYRGKYCNSANGGGDIIDPYLVTTVSLSECQQACETNSLCEGIVVQGFPTTQDDESGYVGRCRKIANLNVSKCASALPTTVLFARSGGMLLLAFMDLNPLK